MNTGDNWQRYKASNIGSAITLYCLITILGSIHEQLPLILYFLFLISYSSTWTKPVGLQISPMKKSHRK